MEGRLSAIDVHTLPGRPVRTLVMAIFRVCSENFSFLHFIPDKREMALFVHLCRSASGANTVAVGTSIVAK